MGRYFNPRSREGSDLSTTTIASSNAYFNPRSREGSDATRSQRTNAACRISIHAPVKGATRWAIDFLHSAVYFNPRSREGSDGFAGTLIHYLIISIHAPVKGATASLTPYKVYLQISIHAPVKGAT